MRHDVRSTKLRSLTDSNFAHLIPVWTRLFYSSAGHQVFRRPLGSSYAHNGHILATFMKMRQAFFGLSLKICLTTRIRLTLPDANRDEDVDERRTEQRRNSKGVGSNSQMTRIQKKNKQKPKINITLHEDTKQKLAALARLEKRSVSNLIEVMVDQSWEKLAAREGVDYAKTVAEIAGLKGLNADKEADRKLFRREVLGRVLKFNNK